MRVYSDPASERHVNHLAGVESPQRFPAALAGVEEPQDAAWAYAGGPRPVEAARKVLAPFWESLR